MSAPELTVEQIDALRFTAFRSNAPDDLEAYYKATSKWFQDRHYRDMAADDALAAHVAAEVAKARAEDAATVLRYRPTGENAKHFVDVLVCDIANEILTGEKAK